MAILHFGMRAVMPCFPFHASYLSKTFRSEVDAVCLNGEGQMYARDKSAAIGAIVEYERAAVR